MVQVSYTIAIWNYELVTELQQRVPFIELRFKDGYILFLCVYDSYTILAILSLWNPDPLVCFCTYICLSWGSCLFFSWVGSCSGALYSPQWEPVICLCLRLIACDTNKGLVLCESVRSVTSFCCTVDCIKREWESLRFGLAFSLRAVENFSQNVFSCH